MATTRPNSRTGRPTIRTVAERAGVSKSLVSLVLRDSPRVSPAKRQAVWDAIEMLGYRPNAAARSLTERRTRAVGVMVNDLRNLWMIDCLNGLNSEVHAKGMHMLLGDARLDRRYDDGLLQVFMERRVDGLVLVGHLSWSPVIAAAAAQLPTVVASDVSLPNVDVVGVDDYHGGLIATRHLVELGHQRIAHLAGSYGKWSERRQHGYEDTMRQHGLEDNIVVERSDPTEEGGYRAAIRLLNAKQRPTAIFSFNDLACVGALTAADELGLAVPGDLSLVGYDNTHFAQSRHLWLTSVDIGADEIGRKSARLLLDQLDKPKREPVEHLTTPTLEVRGSSAPLDVMSG